MARERIIEGTWDCTSCGQQKILARHKQCPSCGSPREEGRETDFDFGERTESGGLVREAVQDADALALSSVGPDWFCAYCQTANRGDATRCRNCSADRAEGQSAAVEPMDAPAPLAAPPPAPVRPAPGGSRLRSCALAGCGAVLLAVMAFCAFGAWLSRTGEYKATVTQVSWSRKVRRETFQKVGREGWRGDLRVQPAVMPVAGRGEVPGVSDLHNCRSEQRSTRQVPAGTHEVCQDRTRRVACGTEEKCRVQKQGNGFAKEVCEDVTRYCDESYRDCRTETVYRTEPVYDTRCAYSTWAWQPAGEAHAEGATDPPRWPDLPLGPLDRQVREERYSVLLEYTRRGKTVTVELKPATEQEFLSWRPGQGVTATISNGGELKGVRRPDQ